MTLSSTRLGEEKSAEREREMGRKPSGLNDGRFKKGAWTPLEDQILIDYVNINGEGKWSKLSKQTGLERGGKSCRLRWLNYLRPDIKRGNISDDEEDLIIRLHKLLGNRWCLIAGRLPGRTDNEIKNYWNTYLSKKMVKANNTKQCVGASNPKGIDMLHMNNPTEAARIYEEADQGIMAPFFKTDEEKGSLVCHSSVDLEIGQLCLSELLELDVDEFNTTMRSTFGEDFCDLEDAYHHAAPIHNTTGK